MNDMDDILLNNNPLFPINKIHIQGYVLFDMDIQLDHLKLTPQFDKVPIKQKESSPSRCAYFL